jgi:hypothetical protein
LRTGNAISAPHLTEVDIDRQSEENAGEDIMKSAAAAALALGFAFAFAAPAVAKDTVAECEALATKLEGKISQKAAGESLVKANAFLEKMKDACANRKFMEAGSAGLDIMIELDRTPS